MLSLRPLARALRTSATPRIVATVFLNFLGYVSIGLPLAVIPGFTHSTLGYGAVLAGLAVSLQYLATFASRPRAGRMVDTRGPRHAVLSGLSCSALAGLLLIAAGWLERVVPGSPAAPLLALLASRVALGVAEGLVGTGTITWAIGQVGAARTAQVISWNGIASYGGIAAGAPLGVLLAGPTEHGIVWLGALTMGLAALGLVLAVRRQGTAATKGERLGFLSILGEVWPHGAALGLGSVGFGVIAAFITLFYAAQGWPAHGWSGSASALSAFGLSFVATRLVFAAQIGRRGGYVVALTCFLAETLGLLSLWRAETAPLALLGAAATGVGFSLIYPALGVEAVARVGAQNRGSALGAYSVFLDISLGLSGPVLGLIASYAGYGSLFLAASIAAAAGGALTAWLRAADRARP